MSSKLRLALPMACIGVVGAACFLLLQSHASARVHMNYAHLNKIQKRIISETLASALGPQSTGARAHMRDRSPRGGDGERHRRRPVHAAEVVRFARCRAGSTINYFPSSQGNCSANLGDNVKVNQNCLNLSDPDLQGRGQANNEPSIAVDPFNPRHLVASDNSYVRGDGTLRLVFLTRWWPDSGRTRPCPTASPTARPFAREYWQAGGDTSVAWDTRGNAYESCQLFNRGTAASANTDQSSTFVVFRATQNNGASWNFPGRYTATFTFDPTGTAGVLEDKALMAIDDNVHSPYRDRIYVTWTEFAADGSAYIYEVHSDDYGETFSNRSSSATISPTCTNTFGVGTPNGHVQREPVLRSVHRQGRKPVRGLGQLQQPAHERERQQLPGAAGQVDRRRPELLGAGSGQPVLRPARLRHLPGYRSQSGTLVRAGEGLVDGVRVPRHELPVGRGRSVQARTSSR